MARILMVNDEIDLLRLCQDTLRESGHDVEISMSGRDAIAIARTRKPDMFIVDWIIPDMDGEALLANLKAIPGMETIPALAISALQDGAVFAARAGADDFLQKPFDADELVDAVAQVLSRA
jgi:two-component system KDP operon response regulator KdpE